MGGPGSGPTAKSTSLHHGAPTVPTDHAPKGTPIVWPGPQANWHATATDLYMSLQKSGQVAFFEQSDVAMAYFAADVTTLALNKESAVMVAQAHDLWDALLATASMRKRMRIDLGMPAAPEKPSKAKLARYQVIAGSAGKEAS